MANTTDFTNFAAEHPNYFPGQYLLEDDFELQHKYLSDRQRYHNQSLHVSGIIEGLGVEVVQGKKAVLIKSGSAIDGNGELIVVKKDITFSEFGNVNSGELYIQFSQEKQVKQQEDVADSYTRWVENPILGFAATTPKNGIKLAKLTISGETITLDSNVREYSGLSLPNSNNQALTLRSGGNANPNLAVLTGSLKIDGDLTVNGTVQCSNGAVGVLAVERIPDLSAGKITTGVLAVDRIPNLSADKITSGSIAGNLTVNGSVQLGGFTDGDTDEWPKVTWYRDTTKNWDEGLIKHSSSKGVFKKAGYGIHLHQTREFGLWSTGWDALLAVEGGTGNTYIKGVMSGAANAYQKAQFTLSGGGIVTWEGPGKRLKWTKRFIGISMERSTSIPAGHINIDQPTTNIPPAQVYDGKARDANADGVVLTAWEALYAVHTVGGDENNVSFQIVCYTNNFNAPSNWLLVAVVNGDDNSVKLGTGTIIASWQTPTFQNSWVNYDTTYNSAGYFKDSLGIVHLKGLVKNGTNNTTIFTLPVGYRPSNRELQAVQTKESTIGRVDILTDGQVTVVSGNNGWVSLDGITFRAVG